MKKNKHKFEVGQKVRVYGLMNPRRDYKEDRIIKAIGPMHSGPDMIWFEGGGGAWHPDACEPINETDFK